jgi:uncharacterized protein
MASLNAGPEYYLAEQKYREAVSHDEKMAALQEMLKHCPKHKSAHSILSEIKGKMARLRKEHEKEEARRKSRGGGRGDFLRKQGAAQVAVVGFANAGKTFLVNALTNADLPSTKAPFETLEATPAMLEHKKVQIQLVDAPSAHEANRALVFGMARNADLAILVIDPEQKGQEYFFAKMKAKKELRVTKGEWDAEELKEKIYEELRLVRVFTKANRGKPDFDKPIVLFKGRNTVADAAREVHKDFARNLECGRVWGSARFPGQQVGTDYELGDGDVLELKMKN